ncbi:MAG: pilin [Elusimicrobiaceae bacterium]|nr:pilin [Elusimicrobiaceae bacterium]
MKKIPFSYKKGFTLVELLVVILIIGILSAVALPRYTKAVEKSRLAAVLPTITTLRNALDEQILAGMEKEEIDYIGGDEIGRDLLMLNVPCQTDLENQRCYGKNFSYRVWCAPHGCFISFVRQQDRTEDDLYAVLWRKVLTDWNDYPIGVWEMDCMAHSDIGYEVCRSMVSHGWELSDERMEEMK